MQHLQSGITGQLSCMGICLQSPVVLMYVYKATMLLRQYNMNGNCSTGAVQAIKSSGLVNGEGIKHACF